MNTNREYKRKIIAIALPLILSNLVSQLQMLIDRVFLGRLDVNRMSAVGNATSPLWTCMSVCFSLAIGGNILISQAIGSGDKKRARELTASLFKYANILALVFFVVWLLFSRTIFQLMGVDESIIDMSVDYASYFSPCYLFLGLACAISVLLQVTENTKILIVYGVLRSGINIALDYGLIFGHWGLPRMEVAGAALATTIAEIIGDFVVLFYVIWNKKISLKPRLREILQSKWSPYWASIKMGLPTACEDFAWNLGNLFIIVMLNRISPDAAGIFTIIFGVELLPVCIIGSLSNGVLTLAGKETGAGNPKGIGALVRISMTWACILCALILASFAIFPSTIIGWFTSDQGIITASAIYLFIVGLDLFPKSINILVGAGIKGHGDTKWMLGTQIFGTIFIISMSALLVMVFHRGIAALFVLVVCDESLRGAINIWKLRRITR